MENDSKRFENGLFQLIDILSDKSSIRTSTTQFYVADKESISDIQSKLKMKKKLFGKKIFGYDMDINKVDMPLVTMTTCIDTIESAQYHLSRLSDFDTGFIDDIIYYADFLRVAEKLFLYNNDEYNYIYSEVSDKVTSIFVRDEENMFKIRVKIEKTKIDNLIDTYANADIDSLFFDNSKLTIVSIDVAREYGKKMVSSFKFPYTSEPQFTIKSDRYLFNLIKDIIANKISESYFYIIESTFKILKVMNLSEDKSYWECFKNNGLFYK